ncbi:MAG: hypothetical protein ACOYMN_07865 [Roseimicrobium sp.]
MSTTRKELLNTAGAWEEMRPNTTAQQVSLGEAWLARPGAPALPALADARLVQGLATGLGRVFKLAKRDDAQIYGKEIALGKLATPEPPNVGEGSEASSAVAVVVPTHAMRKLLHIPSQVSQLTMEKVERVAVPKLTVHFPGANFLGLAEKEGLLWAQFDFAPSLVEAMADARGCWIAQTQTRVVERAETSEIRVSSADPAQTARSGTPVHSWRTLGLIESDGAPTRRGIVFSFFQHGEGLAIAAALEDDTYAIDELVPHLANLRSDCRVDLPQGSASERLAAACSGTYGFVNHHGYLEAGLPLGYGEHTAELLGLIAGVEPSNRGLTREVAEGDLSRAYVEWLSLLRHITHAPHLDWPRWLAFKAFAKQALDQHLAASRATLRPKLPPLTPKQKHERPRHYILRHG